MGSIFFVCTIPVFALQSSIEGTVYSENRKPVSGAHVYIEENKWAISNENGNFTITSLTPGTYEIKISSIGFQDEFQSLTVEENSSHTLEVYLKEKIYRDNPVVVTASRTSQDLEDVSVPVTVIDSEEITRSGNLRLSEVLDEQIGLNIVSNHGTGIQVQGFDPEYTLILIDNQPIIGRTAGTLDLDRLAVGNIEQIEVVKGPSSALWGSEALAGVINIITNKGSSPFSWDVNGRYGTHTTFDGSSNLTFKKDRFTGRFFTNINGSDGYDLNSETIAQTVAQYQNYTFSGGTSYRISKNLNLKLSGRYYRENLSYDSESTINQVDQIIYGEQLLEDYSITPELSISIGSRQLFELTHFINNYNNSTDEVVQSSDDVFFQSNFDQHLQRSEIKSSTFWNDDHTTIFGVGYNNEALVADIYSDVPDFSSYFGFGQHEWQTRENLSFTLGFRFDAHSEYNSQFSPKFSGLFKPNDIVHIRASFGGGFKAPTFNQLFLNFTNSTVGYSVFGTSTVIEGMDNLQDRNQIADIFIQASDVTNIEAESSVSFNLGFDIYPTENMSFKMNAFRNDVEDMIETLPIARLLNNQSVFSYFNLDQVHTQGFDSELKLTPTFIENLSYSIGYQLLDARIQYEDVFDVVENGVIVSTSETRYGLLPGRSKHTGNIKVFYSLDRLGLFATLRAIHRSKFGIDFNGNKRVDEGEYVNEANTFGEALEKTIVNFSISKTFSNRYTLQLGVNNLTNFTDPMYQPHYPGRTFYTQLNIKLY